MNIYLVQHADAKPEKEDPSRPLSEKGLQDIARVASYVATLNIEVHKIFHSTKLRARQTAEVLLENLKPKGGISEADGLSPLDDPNIWAERLRSINEDSIIIGHLPLLGNSLLCCCAGMLIRISCLSGWPESSALRGMSPVHGLSMDISPGAN